MRNARFKSNTCVNRRDRRPGHVEQMANHQGDDVEWPTLALLGACYALWGLAVFGLAAWSPLAALPAVAVLIALHSSLTHEMMHGHPFRSEVANAMLMLPPLSLAIPYLRFKDLHLEHHRDEHLTDPYDDPESNFLDPAAWAALSRPMQRLLRFNNTLLGRMLVGPAIGLWTFWQGDWRRIRAGDRRVILGWALHLPPMLGVIGLVALSPMPVLAYLGAVYLGLSLLKIRTYLEHRAYEKARGRTVVIEDRGPLALLFLNNNFHVVHHMHPNVPWYRLPGLYAARRAHYLARNDGYRYSSYAEVFRSHFLTAKDPVPHPIWPVRKRD